MANKKVQLYEITVLISRSVVVAAVSKKNAMEHIDSWEKAWETSSDFIGVSDVDLHGVRDIKSSDVNDEAHEVTKKAAKMIEKRKTKGT